MEYLPTILAVTNIVGILVGAYIAYKIKKGEEVNKVLKTIHDVYQKIRKLDLLGKIEPDDRLNQALEMVEDILYSENKMDMTTELKKLATKEFEALHTSDKNKILSMDTVATEEPKKKE